MSEMNRRLLLELDKHRYDVNKRTINASIEILNIDALTPIVDMVAKSRAAYIKELMTLANSQTGKALDITQLKARREEFKELIDAANALEIAIKRGYLDVTSEG